MILLLALQVIVPSVPVITADMSRSKAASVRDKFNADTHVAFKAAKKNRENLPKGQLYNLFIGTTVLFRERVLKKVIRGQLMCTGKTKSMTLEGERFRNSVTVRE